MIKEHTLPDGTKHTVKGTQVEVAGLAIDDEKTDMITEAFGVDTDKWTKMCDKMMRFFELQKAQFHLEPNLPMPTKTSTFADFLQSHIFKEAGITLEKPNDYFMLGFAFATVLGRVEQGADIPDVSTQHNCCCTS
jgi:hypothetical protein